MRPNSAAMLGIIMLALCGTAPNAFGGRITFDAGIGGTKIGKDPFTITLENGQSSAKYINDTDMTINDFTFKWDGKVDPLVGADARPRGTTPTFGSYTPAKAGNELDFYIGMVAGGPQGKGIAPGQSFTINITGFTNVANVQATATFDGGTGDAKILQFASPEPSSIILLALGVIGLAGGQAYRRRRTVEVGKGAGNEWLSDFA